MPLPPEESVHFPTSAPTDGRLERTARLLAVTEALNEAVTVSDVTQVILQHVVPLTGAYGGTLVRELGVEHLLVFGVSGYDSTTRLTWSHHPTTGTFPVTTALREKRAVFVSRSDAERTYPDLAVLLKPRTRAVAALPLLVNDDVLAGVTLSFEGEDALLPERQSLVVELTRTCGVAFSRARRYDEQHRAHERATLLAEAGTALAASLDVRATLDRITRLVIQHVADWASVYLPDDEGRPTLMTAAHEDPGKVELLRWFLSQLPYDPAAPPRPDSVAWVMQTGQPSLVPIVPPALLDVLPEGELREAVRTMGLHSIIHVPLKVEGRTLGVLGLASTHPARTYGEADLELAHALASRAALALDNAQLHEAARRSEQRYRSLVDATRQIVWTNSPDGQLLGEQPGWARLTGQDRSTYEGVGWARAVHPDDRAHVTEAWRNAVRTRSAYDVRQRVRVADGSYRHFDVRAVPVLDEDGSVREWVGTHTDVTDRVLAEEQLRASEERFRRLVDASPTGIAVGALDGTLRLVNDAYLGMLGFTREDFLEGRMNWGALNPPEYREADERAFRQVFEAGRSEAFEKDMWRRDGTRVPVEFVLTRYEQHDETFVVAYVQDLTVQKAAQRTLRNHSEELERRVEERTRELEEQRAALDAFVTYTEAVGTQTDTATLVSEALNVLSAHFPSASTAYYEFDGDVWQARAWTDDIREDVLAMMRAGVPADVPLFARTVSARTEVFTDAWDPEREQAEVTDEYGAGAAYPLIVGEEVTGLLVIGLKHTRAWPERDKAVVRAAGRSLNLALERSDQTARLEAHKAELDARARVMEAFATFTRDATLVEDAYQLVRVAQEILAAMLPGVTSVYHELEGEAWTRRTQVGSHVPGGEVPVEGSGPSGPSAEFAAAWNSREPLFVETADGPVGAVAYLPLVIAGEARGLLTVTSPDARRGWATVDRSVIVALTHALELALEGVSATRALQDRTRELERSNAELERFAYVASHDLQEPLRTIASFTGLLEHRYGSAFDERGRTYLRLIVQGAERMKLLVDDLLVYSRLGAEHLTLEAVSTKRVVEEALARLTGMLEDSGGRVTCAELPAVRGDEAQLVQVFQNLIGNALKFQREGIPPVVRVSARRDGHEWQFSVADNGIGIEPQYFERIFVIFQRLHRREEYAGTGLGLAISRKIVERHGGRMWVESHPGEGSAFHFTLPASDEPGA